MVNIDRAMKEGRLIGIADLADDKVRNAVIEECARVVDGYPGGGMQQVDIIKLAIAARIRELKN